MKKGLVFVAATVLITAGLVGCNKGGGDTKTYTVTIANKDVLTKEWHVGESNRTATITISDGVVTADAFIAGDLKVESSDTSVIQVIGNSGLKAVAAGEATITATYKNKFKDSVTISPQAKKAMRVVTTPTVETDYMLAMTPHTGEMVYAAAEKSGYYIKSVDGQDAAADARVVMAEQADGDYKYLITLKEKGSTGEARTIGSCATTGHTNIGFVDEASVDYPFVAAKFKLNADYSLSTMVEGTEYWLGTYGTYYTFSLRDESQILYKAKLYEYGEPIVLNGISLNKSTSALEVGQNETLTVTFDPASYVGNVTWTSSEPTVASVEKGKVTALLAGTTTITASCEGKEATCVFTVTGEPINYGTRENPLTIAEAKAVLDRVGDNVFSAQHLWVKGIVSTSKYVTKYSNYEVWLQSDDGTVAKDFELYAAVLGEGVKGIGTEDDSLKGYEVIAQGVGEKYVKSGSTTYELTRKDSDNPVIEEAKLPEVDLENIVVTVDKTDIKVDEETEYTVEAAPLGAVLPADLVVEVDGTYVESVKEGVIKGKAVGQGWIKASSVTADKSTKVDITVSSGTAVDVWENKTTETLTAIDALPYPEDGSKSSTEYAIIGKLGEITKATSFGNSTIATKDASTSITVYGMKDLTGTYNYSVITQNKPAEKDVVVLKGKIQNYNGTTKEIIDAKILQVNGVVCEIPELTGVAVAAETVKVEVGKTSTIKASPVPADSFLDTVTYASSAEAVATVDTKGVITGVAAGTAEITVKSDNGEGRVFTKKVAVTVEAGVAADATFTLGTDGKDGKHADGSGKDTYTETCGTYTLSITDGVKFYTGGHDAKNNSFVKFGTSSAGGSCTINVPTGITKVKIYAAGYKAADGKIVVNGGSEITISSHSDDGEYTAVECAVVEGVVTLASGSVARWVINTIEFYK